MNNDLRARSRHRHHTVDESCGFHPLPLTPRSQRILDLAQDEARRLGHDYIGTEHLLLGMLQEGEGIAAGVLMSLVPRSRIEDAVYRIIRPSKPNVTYIAEIARRFHRSV